MNEKIHALNHVKPTIQACIVRKEKLSLCICTQSFDISLPII